MLTRKRLERRRDIRGVEQAVVRDSLRWRKSHLLMWRHRRKLSVNRTWCWCHPSWRRKWVSIWIRVITKSCHDRRSFHLSHYNFHIGWCRVLSKMLKETGSVSAWLWTWGCYCGKRTLGTAWRWHRDGCRRRSYPRKLRDRSLRQSTR